MPGYLSDSALSKINTLFRTFAILIGLYTSSKIQAQNESDRYFTLTMPERDLQQKSFITFVPACVFVGKRLSRNSCEKISKLFSSLSLNHTCEICRIVDTEKNASSSDINVDKLYPGNTKVILPYHNTVDLLFNWFGINCRTTDSFCFYLQNRLI